MVNTEMRFHSFCYRITHSKIMNTFHREKPWHHLLENLKLISQCLRYTRVARTACQRTGYHASTHIQVVHVVFNRKWIAQSGKLTLYYQNMTKRCPENVPIYRYFGRRTQRNGHVLYWCQTSSHVMLTVYFATKIFQSTRQV